MIPLTLVDYVELINTITQLKPLNLINTLIKHLDQSNILIKMSIDMKF